MNRILFEASEREGNEIFLTDHRADHIRKVLKPGPGERLRTGEVDGPVSEAEVIDCDADGVRLRIVDGEVPARPGIDLILALPRPKVLNRLLPQISALGVDRLILCNASRVERYYFDTHVLEERHLRTRLVEGLMQSGDTCLPQVKVVRQLRHFLEDDLEGFSQEADRWILHPGASRRLLDLQPQHTRRVLAIGPEGGWRESELAGFTECGFQSVSLMDRILRSDTATIAALALVSMSRRA